MKVLVVDDKQSDRKLLSKLLISNNYQAVEARNGKEALECARSSKPVLIISDIMMPVMDGFTMLRELKKDPALKAIPFVFYTAHYVSDEDRELAASLGASRFIVKPTEPRDLLSEIEAVLNEYESGLIKPAEPLISTQEEYLSMYSERLVRKLEDKYEELDKTRNFLNTVIDEMYDGVMVCDTYLNLIYCNSKMREIKECGYPDNSMLPDFIHKPCIPDMANASSQSFEIELVNEKGNTVILEGIVSPAQIESGDVTSHIGVFRDITERRKSQHEIDRKNIEISTLYELDILFSGCTGSDELVKSALDRIIEIMDLEGGMVHLINNEDKTIKTKLSVRLPPKFIELISHQTLDAPAIQQVLESKTPVNIFQLHERIQGLTQSEQEYGEVNIVSVKLISRGLMMGLADLMIAPHRELKCDEQSLLEKFGMQLGVALENFLMLESLKQEIQEREQAENELKEHKEHLEDMVEERTSELQAANEQLQDVNIRLSALDRAKNMFLSSVNHELHTPLTSILGFSSLLLQGKTGNISEEQHKQLTIVYNSAQHLTNLINDVFDANKIEAGRVELIPETFLLADVIQEITESIQLQCTAKGLECLSDIPSDIQVYQDKHRFKQVLMNLISNSIKFTHKGNIEIQATKIDDDVLIHVKDSGIGIKSDDIAKLFQPFVQISTAQGHKPDGTGLGLYLNNKLVGMMGGKVWASSEFGTGSVFSIQVPITYQGERVEQKNPDNR